MQHILIKGAKTHNLKNVDVSIPRNKLIVVTGVSGSGKSSLTIDTLYAEGQRKYIESLSSYARQFLQRMNKPDVEYIKGLSPAIAIEQKVSGATNRSTVGTMTEIYDYLRLFFARAGETYSPISNTLVKKDEVVDVLDYIKKVDEGKKFFLGYKVLKQENIEQQLTLINSKGFSKIWIKDAFHDIEELIENSKILSKAKDYIVVVQRFKSKSNNEEEFYNQLADSVQLAFEENHYECLLYDIDTRVEVKFNNRFEADDMLFEIPNPQLFNFNNSYGACPICEGVGSVFGIDEDLVIPDKSATFYDNMVMPWRGVKMRAYHKAFLDKATKNNFPIHRSYENLSKEEISLLWDGTKDTKGIYDFFKMVEENTYKIEYRILLSRYRGKAKCRECQGYRIRKDAEYVKIAQKSIQNLLSMPIWDLSDFFKTIKLNSYQKEVSKRILLEINNRLDILIEVGLGYLTMERVANSLSGGENQRINLTRSIGSNLTDSMYILDEPSIGLHPRDTRNLIKVLKKLRDLNNTVIVVEHEEEVIKACDYIIDVGPLAGVHGGEIVYQGDFENLKSTKNSLTTQYLLGEKQIKRENIKSTFHKYIEIKGARQFNLKNIDVKIPLEAMVVVSGVSGSGKTSLIKHILYPAMQHQLGIYGDKPGIFDGLDGDIKTIDNLELIDQNPLGRSSRSNPVTYVKAYDYIRDLFSKLPQAVSQKLLPKDFSFNVPGGRCELCKGDGVQVVSMQFLADVELVCEECKGKRFQHHVLDVQYHDKSIFDILEMTIDEAVVFFKSTKNIHDRIKPLQDIGLGYLTLGQSSSTLSGGEAQRVKLASYLHKSNSKTTTLFIFDEPTTGLHYYDVQKLLNAFDQLIKMGNSIVVIEHNIDVIRNADYVIDLGIEGGEKGGELIYQGSVNGLKAIKKSYTAQYL